MAPRSRILAAAATVTGLTLALVAGSHAGALVAAEPDPVTPLPANAPFDYQIGGAYAPRAAVKVVARDRNDPPAAGLYNICYVNAFQSQPDAAELAWWRARDLVLRDASGAEVIDGGWDEVLLDLRTDAKRRAVAARVGEWIDGCADAGYQAVEPDNLDSFTRSEGLLTAEHAIAFVTLLAEHAHRRGLAIAQKNAAGAVADGGIGAAGPKAGLDFAIAEECGRYDECQAYRDLYGDRVVVIEYTTRGFRAACTAVGASVSVVRRNTAVTPRGPYQEC